MSPQSMEDIWRPIEEANFKAVQRDTWGHLAPEENKTYKGYVLFTQTVFGEYVIIDANFEGLPESPWLFDAMTDFIEEHAKEDGSIYRFDGTFRNYEFKGPIAKLSV